MERTIAIVGGTGAGRLETARLAEQLTALLIAVNLRYKVRASGFRFTGLPIPQR